MSPKTLLSALNHSKTVPLLHGGSITDLRNWMEAVKELAAVTELLNVADLAPVEKIRRADLL